jgi:transposase
MISVPAGARVLLATRPIDFRKGAHSLAALAQEVLTEDPFSGAVIVYRAKRSDRLKILVWDSSGLVLAIAAGIVPLAADHGRGDEAVAC